MILAAPETNAAVAYAREVELVVKVSALVNSITSLHDNEGLAEGKPR